MIDECSMPNTFGISYWLFSLEIGNRDMVSYAFMTPGTRFLFQKYWCFSSLKVSI